MKTTVKVLHFSCIPVNKTVNTCKFLVHQALWSKDVVLTYIRHSKDVLDKFNVPLLSNDGGDRGNWKNET